LKKQIERTSPSRAPRYRIVVFDLDGTLADTAPDLAASVNVMLLQMGRKALTIDEVRALLGDGVRELVRRALAASGDSSEELFNAHFLIFLHHYESHIADHSRAWPGANEALHALRSGGVVLALCTNKLEQLTTPLLNSLGWTELFSVVICGDTLSARKPDPAPLLEAVRRAGGGPALFVGDTSVDLATAEGAGLPVVIIDMIGGSAATQDPRARTIISDFSVLVDSVLGVEPTGR